MSSETCKAVCATKAVCKAAVCVEYGRASTTISCVYSAGQVICSRHDSDCNLVVYLLLTQQLVPTAWSIAQLFFSI